MDPIPSFCPVEVPSPYANSFSPVIYRVARDGEVAKSSVHLGCMKAYQIGATKFNAGSYRALDYLLKETALPVRGLDVSVLTVRIDLYIIEAVESHKRGPDKTPLSILQYFLLACDELSSLGIWKHVNKVPQWHEVIRAYRVVVSI